MDLPTLQAHIYNGQQAEPILVNLETGESGERAIQGAWETLNQAIEHRIHILNENGALAGRRRYSTLTPRNWHNPTPTLGQIIEATRKAAAATRFTATPAAATVTPRPFAAGDRVRIIATRAQLVHDGLMRAQPGMLGTLGDPDGAVWWNITIDGIDGGLGRYLIKREHIEHVLEATPAPPPVTLDDVHDFGPGDRVYVIGEAAWLREDALPDDLIEAFEDDEQVVGTITRFHQIDHPGYNVEFDNYGDWWIREDNLDLL